MATVWMSECPPSTRRVTRVGSRPATRRIHRRRHPWPGQWAFPTAVQLGNEQRSPTPLLSTVSRPIDHMAAIGRDRRIVEPPVRRTDRVDRAAVEVAHHSRSRPPVTQRTTAIDSSTGFQATWVIERQDPTRSVSLRSPVPSTAICRIESSVRSTYRTLRRSLDRLGVLTSCPAGLPSRNRTRPLASATYRR